MMEANLEFFLAHRASLVECAARHIGSSAWAEDVVQEAYLRFDAATKSSEVSIRWPLGYLRRIVRNLALDWANHLYPDWRRASDAPARIPAGEVTQVRALPELAALRREELRMVARALEELPTRTRLAFELHHLDGLTLDEIRLALGISTSLAHKLVQSARSHCADRLRER
jgi:RNA polymerase sigma factor (sigma-70 family)